MRKINTDLSLDIYNYTVTGLIDIINETKEDAEIDWNSHGGSVYAGQKFADFLNNKEFKLNANVSGIAASMGAVLLPFFDSVKGSNQADVMLHSASGGAKVTLKRTNEFLYAALSKKIDEEIFKKITGYDLKTIMLAEDENRVDVWFSGKDAKKMGLFDETYDLLDKAASLENKIDFTDIGYEVPENIKLKYAKKEKIVKSNNNEMEYKDVKKAELQTGNPSVYNAIIEEGKTAAQPENIAIERARVASIMKYAKYDYDKAALMVEKGEKMDELALEHFIEKKHASKVIEDLEEGSEGAINPGKKVAKVEDKRTPEEKADAKELADEKRAILEDSGFELKTEKS